MALLAFKPLGLFGQRTSARDVVYFGLWPYFLLGRLAFLAKERLHRCCLFSLWPSLVLLAFRPFGFLAKEHLRGMLFIWPLDLLAFRPFGLLANLFGLLALLAFRSFGLFGQRTSARDVVYLAFGPIGL